jgi:hypothetical protein
MFTYAIRISHDVAEAYQEAMAQTFKDFQVTFRTRGVQRWLPN